jgi:hypothetical protein
MSSISATKSQGLPSISTLTNSGNQTVKALFASSAAAQANNSPNIISISASTLNQMGQNVQQAVPIFPQSANSSLSQVLRQFSAVNSSTQGNLVTTTGAGNDGSAIQIVSLPSQTITSLTSAQQANPQAGDTIQQIQVTQLSGASDSISSGLNQNQNKTE